MHLVLDEKVDQWDECAKERAREHLPVFDSRWVRWAERETSQCPWQSRDKIRNHEDIMPIVVIRRSDICPASTSECPEDAHSNYEFGEGFILSGRHCIP